MALLAGASPMTQRRLNGAGDGAGGSALATLGVRPDDTADGTESGA